MLDEARIRLICFVTVFLVVAVLEVLQPRRQLRLGRTVRWPNNLGIVVLNTLLLRVAFPTALVAFAASLNTRDAGLLAGLPLPDIAIVIIAVVLLDLAIYAQHRVFHAVPVLWRLHRMHHADPDVDVTTGLRFHPLEVLLSLVFKFAVVWLLGPPALGVLIFEVLLNAGSLFSHANLKLPHAVEHPLRALLVTPEMHRVHHSVRPEETDSNFGFCLSVWDRLFRSYRSAAVDDQARMALGLKNFRGAREQGLLALLMQPFRSAGPP